MGAGPLAKRFALSLALALPLAVPLAGCAGSDAFTARVSELPTNWRAVATEDDRNRLRKWRDAFVEGLAAANRTNANDVRAAGVLLQPDLGIDKPMPPVGDYRCRTTKLGSSDPGSDMTYIEYPWFECRVEDRGNGTLRLTKLTGSQRPIGTIFEAERNRAVFLGVLQLSDETAKIPYGRDKDRDMAGWVQRIGAARWRIIFPRPHFESVIDVLELVPQ